MNVKRLTKERKKEGKREGFSEYEKIEKRERI